MSNKTTIGIAIALGSLFFASAVLLLNHGHLNEDAYILFQYSKKLAGGEGIVFDQLSGPTEGATDFLWMVVLALMHRLGLDLGTAAALLNGVGLAVTAWVVLKLSVKPGPQAVCGLMLVVFSGGLAAALGGFSTLAYGGLFALFTFSVLKKHYKMLGVLALAIPLFRPDGLLLVLGGVAAAFYLADKTGKWKLVFYLFPAFLLGAGYFIWRMVYFDMLLPLPLLVKSKPDRLLDGLGENVAALRWYLFLLVPLAVLLVKKGLKNIDLWKYIAIGLGPFLLLVALSFAHQSQNIGYRFQYPIMLSWVFIFIVALNEFRNFKKIGLVLPLFGILFGVKLIHEHAVYLVNNDYINSFPQLLRRTDFTVDTIAVTEAGRFPFWYDAKKMVDLVGLNSSAVVKFGPGNVLATLKPDLVFVHHAGRFDMSQFDSARPFFVAEAASIKMNTQYSGKNPVLVAPEAALRFAKENGYLAVPVHYGSADTNFSHVFFLSPKVDKDVFITTLEQSLQSKISYYQSLQK